MKLRIAIITLSISSLFYSQQLEIQTRNNAGITSVGTNSGFFQTSTPENFPKPDTPHWWYLIDTRHGDPRYAMQLSGSFFDQNLWFRKIDPGIPNQAWSKVVLENPSGNVGIGIDVPQVKLDVNGSIWGGNFITSETRNSTNAWIIHTPSTNNGTSLIFASKLANGWDWDHQIVFNKGNVSVSQKLEAREVKVTQSPTADFVFEETYGLPKLEDVEKHIKEKKHLPEIASAKEMEKEGVNIGEFQIKLLQKIEELTLYSIEQNKQVKQQVEESKQQQEKIKSLELENQQFRTLLKRVEKLEQKSADTK